MGNGLKSLPLAAALLAVIPLFSSPEAHSVDYKLDRIRSRQVRPGTAVVFTAQELNSWVAAEVPHYAPQGVRDTHLELGNGVATATAVIDFLKVRQTQGAQPGWLVSRLIQGEHPVRVTAHIQSSRGQATVYLDEVDVSGISVSGGTLDFLVDNFVKPLFPDAKINQPFPLDDNVDRIEVQPNVARAVIRAR